MTASTALSAERLNKLTEHGLDVYRKTLRADLKGFTQDGYVAGLEPGITPDEEFQALTPNIQGLLAVAIDPNVPAPIQERAYMNVRRWLQLRRILSERTTAAPQGA